MHRTEFARAPVQLLLPNSTKARMKLVDKTLSATQSKLSLQDRVQGFCQAVISRSCRLLLQVQHDSGYSVTPEAH